jgi:hypothetical protein
MTAREHDLLRSCAAPSLFTMPRPPSRPANPMRAPNLDAAEKTLLPELSSDARECVRRLALPRISETETTAIVLELASLVLSMIGDGMHRLRMI